MKKSIVCLSIFAALSGCGGGGGGGENAAGSGGQPSSGTPTTPTPTTTTAPVAPVVPVSVPPATSVPAPTYAATDERSKLFTLLNEYRVQMGVGALKQDPLLDTAAKAHSDYIDVNSPLHEEEPAKPRYYGAMPRDRATKAGVPASTWVGELIGGGGTGWLCFKGLANSVYHLQALTSNAESVGLGLNLACVIDLGTFTGQTGTPTFNSIPLGGGQQMAANAIAYSPLDGEAIDRALGGETPQPAPDIANPGHPIMVRVRADLMTDVLSVGTFTVVDGTGASVPGRILIPLNAKAASVGTAVTDNRLDPGVAFFIPLTPLGSAVTYTATFSGARNSVPISKSWSFKTYP